MSFLNPEMLWLLASLPLLGWVALWCWRRWSEDLGAWVSRGLWRRLLPRSPVRRRGALLRAGLLGWIAAGLILGLARPRWGLVEQIVESGGLDVVFVLDSSLSMACEDVRPSRLGAAKTIVRQLVRKLGDGRVALVQAEGESFHLTPLTRDTSLVDLLLDTVEPASLPAPGTALAPALGKALEVFPREGTGERAVILLTDGEDHVGGVERQIPKLRAAGIRVFALGIGTSAGAPVPERDSAASAVRAFKQDARGEKVFSRLEEAVLRGVARETGGEYLRVERAGVDLETVVAGLEELAAGDSGEDRVERLAERFQWPLAASALGLVAYLLSPFAFRRLLLALGPISVGLLTLAPGGASFAGTAAVSRPAPPAAIELDDSRGGVEGWMYNARRRTAAAVEAYTAADFAAAAAAAEEALRLRPEDPRAWFNAGTAGLAAGRADAAALLAGAEVRATAAGDEVLAADALFNLGNVYLERRQLPLAVEAYRRALRRAPRHEDAKFNLEWALRQLEQTTPPSPQGGGGETPPPSPEGGEPPAGEEPPADGATADGPPPPDTGTGEDGAPSEGSPEELSPEQTSAILAAVEELEREQRRKQQTHDAGARPTGTNTKDW